MVDSTVNQTQPEHLDGVMPVDLPVLPEYDLSNLENLGASLEAFHADIDRIEKLDHYIQSSFSKPELGMLKYAVEKYGLGDVISVEDISDSAKQVWERTRLGLKRFQSDLYGYAKVLQSGTDRIVERISMLYDMASNIKDKPYKEQIEIRKNAKFGIDGKFEPHDIRPVMEQTQNLLDFYDKVLLPYMAMIDKMINNLSFDQEWTEDATINFSLFFAKRWLKGAVEVEGDHRFRVNAVIYRSGITQGNRAIYFSGPTEAETDKIKDWAFMVNSIRDFRFKFYTVPELKPINAEDNKIDVPAAQQIRQRLGVLMGLAKRLQSRKGYDQKISAALRKLEQSADKVRAKAGQIREETNSVSNQGQEPKDEARPAVSNVISDLTMILNNVTRMITDYNNALAGIIRLISAMTLIADLELEAYQAPLRKPTEEEQKKLTPS